MSLTEISSAPIEVQTTVINVASDGIIDAPDDVKALRKAAAVVQDCAKWMQEKYYDLCTVIRDRQISPETVQKELAGLGFAPSRIAEIKKVSFCTPTVFLEYKEKTIGFKLALKAARAEGKDASKTAQRELPLRKTVTFKDSLTEVLELEYPLAGKASKVRVSFAATLTVHGRKMDVTISEQEPAGSAPTKTQKAKKGTK